ncbi:UNKNOWN [Stylonychia lemnae]|uniref:Uncharacterized protein n=1 Tax=Stylonychia lemnae TaxID=5949 RepID=A0A078A798_STYLE|nr:UNKNOWN [Stylonychia lemnae]|eukprot:CDW78124.1 UNKNOWN [Stylonychia lemnae]
MSLVPISNNQTFVLEISKLENEIVSYDAPYDLNICANLKMNNSTINSCQKVSVLILQNITISNITNATNSNNTSNTTNQTNATNSTNSTNITNTIQLNTTNNNTNITQTKNTFGPLFEKDLENLQIQVGEKIHYEYPKIIDEDNDQLESAVIKFGRAKNFISGSFPNYILKPSQSDIGSYQIFINLTDDNPSPKSSLYFMRVSVTEASKNSTNQSDYSDNSNQTLQNETIELGQYDQNTNQNTQNSKTSERQLLTAKISQISNSGEVRVKFSHLIEIPTNYKQINNQTLLLELFDYQGELQKYGHTCKGIQASNCYELSDESISTKNAKTRQNILTTNELYIDGYLLKTATFVNQLTYYVMGPRM